MKRLLSVVIAVAFALCATSFVASAKTQKMEKSKETTASVEKSGKKCSKYSRENASTTSAKAGKSEKKHGKYEREAK